MKIAHVLWSLGTGGAENMVVDIANIQAETEEVAIFVINDWVEQYMLDRLVKQVKVFLLRRKPGSKNPLPILKFNYLLWKYKPDVIHHHATGSVNCQKVLKSIPKVRTIHGLDNPSQEYPQYKMLYAISDAVKAITKVRGFDSMTIWNGIMTEKINTEKTNPFNDGCIHFVQVSRLISRIKGQDIVIDAMNLLKKKGVNNVKMHFVGDGISEDELRNQAKRLGVEDIIVFEGRKSQQDIYQELANYDLFVLASRREGFGLTIAEAMIAKVPVLVCDLDATMEVIGHGKLGMYFKSENAQDLCDKMFTFVKNGRSEKQVKDAYQFAKDNYDIRNTVKKYNAEYKRILSLNE